MKIKKGDILLIIIALTIGIIAILYLNFMPKSEGGYVKVYIDNQEYDSLPLYIDDTLIVENGEYKNTITIENGTAFMTYANCPDLVCIKHKPIKYTAEIIVCLPHKVVMEIVGGQESDVDAYAYLLPPIER